MSHAKELSISTALPMPQSKFKTPQLGFGVYDSLEDQCVSSCLTALKVGYRKIDTAQLYGNEVQVGRAVQQSDVPRSEIFITTKIFDPADDLDSTVKSILDSVEKIDPGKDGYVDLFEIHTPDCGEAGRRMLWEALEMVQGMGKIRDIGVSNYGIKHLEEMKAYAKRWPPAVNQIELHPWCQQPEIVSYCEKHGIVIEAYCPIVRNLKAKDPTLLSIAEKYGKSTSQVLIRYCLQKGWSPLPKSDNPDRIAANADVYDFNISEADIKALDGLDQGAKGALVMVVEN